MVVIYAYLYSYNQFPCASSVFMYFIFTTLVRRMCRDVMCRSEDSFVDSVFSFHYVTLGDLTGRLSSNTFIHRAISPLSCCDLFFLLPTLFHRASLLERALHCAGALEPLKLLAETQCGQQGVSERETGPLPEV